ncbi:myb-like protein X isoform X3 [Maniola jurtina]|uniref:myb-like protein X isoform X3 n=1 Tax=Maniola jurtina TaxID=191418 RepID=UPI001E68692F|nr:myb-like protein X isoform X3 [Maniola jurtina]
MSSSRIPSPARSHGVPTTIVPSPRPRQSRRTRSVCSATSNTSLRLTAVIQDPFEMSLMPDRMSMLNDDTDIQIPGRPSWWKRLGNHSRDVTEILQEAKENEAIVKVNNVADEFDVEILSQEKENVSVDLPDSSDGESIHSIVIPQRKLFTNQDNRPQKKLKETIIRKETLVKMQKSYFDQTNIDKEINVMPKKLFNQASKPKTKPVFTEALLNASANKTVNVNKSMEKQTHQVQRQVRNLFGNRPGTTKKNVYAEFLLSDSENEIPEIQPRVFGFQKKTDHQQTSKRKRRSGSQNSVHSSASNMTDIEIAEWQHLPSSTMVEHQFEDVGVTPLKRSRLSRLSKPRESDIASNKNNSIKKSKRSNSKILYPESEEMNVINTRSRSSNNSKNNSNLMINNNKSLTETSKKNISKLGPDVSMDKTLTEEILQAGLVNKEHEITLTEENQHTDEADDENFTLEYDNDDEQIFDMNVKNCESNQNISNKEKNHNADVTKTDRNSQKPRNSPTALEITEKQSVIEKIDSSQKESNLNKQAIQNVSQIQRNDMYEEELNEMNEEIVKGDALKGREIVKTDKRNEKNGNQSKQELSENQEIGLQEAEVQEESESDHEFKQKETEQTDNKSEQMEHKQIEIDKRDEQQSDRHKTNEPKQKNQHIDTNNEKIDSKEQTQNLTHETSGKSKNKEILKSPEAVLHKKSKQGESFNTHGRNTSFSKSKTMIKDLNIRPSLAPARDSTGLTNGTINSSAEGSGWDSHRTTRKTLRMTFGKDFTPRKSLRTLVMERAAKRQTNNQNDQVADKSKRKSNFNETINKSKDNSKMQTSIKKFADTSSVHAVADNSKHQNSFNEIVNKPNQSKRQTYFGDITNKRPIANSTELPDFESYQEQEEKLERQPEKNLEEQSDQEPKQDKEVEMDQIAEQNTENKSDQKAEHNPEVESDQEREQSEEVESDQEAEQSEEVESDQEPDQNEVIESDQKAEQSEDVESEQEAEQSEDVESEQDLDQDEESESGQETEQNPEMESDQEPDENEIESDPEAEQNSKVESDQETEQNEEVESDQEAEQTEEFQSDQEPEQAEEVESDQEPEQNDEVESDQEPEQNESESDKELEQREGFDSYREPEPMDVDETYHESSEQLKLTTREMFFEKLRQENAERRRKVQEKVMNMLKGPRDPFSAFKIPEVPKQKRTTKTTKKVTQTKLKPSLFSNELPPQFFEDLKYKPPKRFQGKNAPWITKRLYKFLEDKLQPKYDYRARVRAEKLVEKLYLFAKDVRKCARAAPPQAISELKLEMARLGIVTTHYQFYGFFHEFMPREIRIRVNPDIMNKMPQPTNVFGNILED